MRKNYDLIDLIKFIGSFMIVAMHMSALRELSPAGHFYGLELMTRWAVPFFFATSAFFLYSKTGGEASASHTGKYVKRILILYGAWFVVNIVSIAYKVLKGGVGELGTWLTILRNMTIGSVYTAAWYMLGSVFAAGLILLLSKKLQDKWVVVITCVIHLFCVVTSTYKGLLPGALNDFFSTYVGSTCNTLISGSCFFMVGKIVAKHYDKLSNLPRWLCGMGAMVSYALYYGEILLLQHFGVLGTTDTSFFLLPTAFFLLLLTLACPVKLRGSSYFRKMSTFVFCSQGTVNLMGCLVAKIIGMPYTHVEFICAAALMLLLGGVLIWLQPKWKILNYLT